MLPEVLIRCALAPESLRLSALSSEDCSYIPSQPGPGRGNTSIRTAIINYIDPIGLDYYLSLLPF